MSTVMLGDSLWISTATLIDWASLAVIGRVIERLLVILFAGLSVYLGYRLFGQLPGVRDSNGEVKLPALDMTVKVTRVGPGVFFAIFGVAVLLSSYLHPVSVEFPPSQVQQAGSGSTGGKFTGMSPAQAEQDEVLRKRQIAQAIRSLNAVQASVSKIQSDEERRDRSDSIRDVKLLLMDLAWQPAWGDSPAFKQAVSAGQTQYDKALPQPTREALAFYAQVEGKR